MSAVQDKLSQMMACPTAMLWAKDYEDILEAWNQCDRGDWMLWLLDHLKIDRTIVNEICCLCCDDIAHQLLDSGDDFALKTIEEVNVTGSTGCAGSFGYERTKALIELLASPNPTGNSTDSLTNLRDEINRNKLEQWKIGNWLDVDTQLKWASEAAVSLYDVVYRNRKDPWFVFYYAARSDQFYKANKLKIPWTPEDSLRNYSRLVRERVDPALLLASWNAWSK